MYKIFNLPTRLRIKQLLASFSIINSSPNILINATVNVIQQKCTIQDLLYLFDTLLTLLIHDMNFRLIIGLPLIILNNVFSNGTAWVDFTSKRMTEKFGFSKIQDYLWYAISDYFRLLKLLDYRRAPCPQSWRNPIA